MSVEAAEIVQTQAQETALAPAPAQVPEVSAVLRKITAAAFGEIQEKAIKVLRSFPDYYPYCSQPTKRCTPKENAEIKKYVAALPRELRELLMAKTLPARIILQFMPHEAAARIIQDVKYNPANDHNSGILVIMPCDDILDFNYFTGEWGNREIINVEIRNYVNGNTYEVSNEDRNTQFKLAQEYFHDKPRCFLDFTPRNDILHELYDDYAWVSPLEVAIRVRNLRAINFYINKWGNRCINSFTLKVAADTGNLDIFRTIRAQLDNDEIGDEDINHLVLIAVKKNDHTILFEIMKLCNIDILTVLEIMLTSRQYKKDDIFTKLLENYEEHPDEHPTKVKNTIIDMIIELNDETKTYFNILYNKGWITDTHIDKILEYDDYQLFSIVFGNKIDDSNIDEIFQLLARHEFPEKITAEFFQLPFELTIPRLRILFNNGGREQVYDLLDAKL